MPRPSCSAQSGKLCLTPSGREFKKPHIERTDAFSRWQEAEYLQRIPNQQEAADTMTGQADQQAEQATKAREMKRSPRGPTHGLRRVPEHPPLPTTYVPGYAAWIRRLFTTSRTPLT